MGTSGERARGARTGAGNLKRTIKLDMTAPKNLNLIKLVFEAKRVPLELIGKIKDFREFHREDFKSVIDTVKPGVLLQDFDFYFDFVLHQAAKLLKALENE